MKRVLKPLLAGILLTGALPAFCAADADTAFTIQGQLDAQQTGKIFLRYVIAKTVFLDSSLITNGRFAFKGFIGKPVQANVYTQQLPGHYEPGLELYVEPGNIFITGYSGLQGAVIQGGRTQVESQVWKVLVKPVEERTNQLISRKYYNRENKDSVRALTLAVKDVYRERQQLELAFIKRFPDSYVSWNMVEASTIAIDASILGPQLAAMSPAFQHSEEGKKIAVRLEAAKRVGVGSQVLDFSQPDANGKMISVASYRGQYVFVDFWASWCGPCRMENPYVLKAYDVFKDKGFTVLGVSLDNEDGKAKWLDAVAHDKMPWTQVSDLKGWKNEAAVLYDIKAIPQNMLIDPTGKIVARNLRGDDLWVTLEQILKEQN